MKCINPYRMKNPQFPEKSDLQYIDCACGKCYSCLVNRRNSWLFRLTNQALHSAEVYFLTLTYNDGTCDGFLHREHLQRFIKSYRYRFPACDVSYYAIGEYGTRTLRPHYHLILFHREHNPEGYCQHYVDKYWKYGFNLLKPSNISTINYVLHYHVRPKEPEKGKKGFSAFSKRLGLDYLLNIDGSLNQNFVNLLAHSTLRVITDVYARKFVVPRYYVKKAEELGISVKKPKFEQNWLDSNMLDIVRRSYPDRHIRMLPDGTLIGISSYEFTSTMFDVIENSKHMLDKYNYQIKSTSI